MSSAFLFVTIPKVRKKLIAIRGDLETIRLQLAADTALRTTGVILSLTQFRKFRFSAKQGWV